MIAAGGHLADIWPRKSLLPQQRPCEEPGSSRLQQRDFSARELSLDLSSALRNSTSRSSDGPMLCATWTPQCLGAAVAHGGRTCSVCDSWRSRVVRHVSTLKPTLTSDAPSKLCLHGVCAGDRTTSLLGGRGHVGQQPIAWFA